MEKIILNIPNELILGGTEIQKTLTKQRSFNRTCTAFAVFVTLYLVAEEIRLQEQNAKIEYLNRELEKLKTSEGEL